MATSRVSIPFTFYYPSGSSPQLYASQSAGSYTSGTAFNSLEPVVNTSVTITDRNTLAAATIYQSETGAATFSSLSTNASGGVSGWVDPGSYKIVAAALGAFIQTTINFEAVRGDGVTLIAANAVNTAAIAPNAVDSTKLATNVQQALVPVGTILDYAGAVAPPGFLIANGQIVSTTTYSALAGVLGTRWNTGGEGAGNVRLPNFQQSVAMGVVNSSGTGAPGTVSSTANALGLRGGQLDHVHTVPTLSVSVTVPQLSVPSTSVFVNDHSHYLSGSGGAAIHANGAYFGSGIYVFSGIVGPTFRDGGFAASSGSTSSNSGTSTGNYWYSAGLMGTTDGIIGGGVAGNTGPTSTTGTPPAYGSTTSNPNTTPGANQQYVAVNKIIKY